MYQYIIFLLCAFLMPLRASASNLQAGIILNDPTGISLKAWIDQSMAVDGALSLNISDNSWVYMHSSFLYHSFNLFEVEGGKLPLYLGVGVKSTIFKNTYNIGARVPVGVSYIYGQSLFDIFFEFAPYLDVEPATAFGFQGAMGFRFFI